VDRAVHDTSLAAGILDCRFGAGAFDERTGDCDCHPGSCRDGDTYFGTHKPTNR